MKIVSTIRRMQTFMLLHEVTCEEGNCKCQVHPVRGTLRTRTTPQSLTVPAMATVSADERVRGLPDVVSAEKRGDIRIVDDPPVHTAILNSNEPPVESPPKVSARHGKRTT